MHFCVARTQRTQSDINQIDYQLSKKINKIENKWIQINRQKTLKTNVKKYMISAYRDIVVCNSPLCIEGQF